MTEMLLYLYAESPIHAGAADSLGALDLPIQREATTGYPVIWGQSLKGALRQAAVDAGWDNNLVTEVFGRQVGDTEEDTAAGLLTVGDAQLVAMPVPTLRRTFAWVTSALALGRLARKYRRLLGEEPPPVPNPPGDSGTAAHSDWAGGREEVLGPLLISFGQGIDGDLKKWADRLAREAVIQDAEFKLFTAKLRNDLLLVGADVMPVLLRECTEQTARVKLTETTKTVDQGPFYSEYLPAETILAAALTLRGNGPGGPKLRELLDGRLLQVGGDETLGKGLAWTRLHVGQASGAPA